MNLIAFFCNSFVFISFYFIFEIVLMLLQGEMIGDHACQKKIRKPLNVFVIVTMNIRFIYTQMSISMVDKHHRHVPSYREFLTFYFTG